MGKEQFSPVRFIIKYFLIMSVFLMAIGFEPIKKVIDFNGLYTKAVVLLCGKILSAINSHVTTNGSLILLPGFAMDVKFGCNGLEAVLIYMAALLAYPASWISRIVGIIVGMVVIQILNILRISMLGIVGLLKPQWFQVFHIYVAQGIMIVVAFVLFIGWLWKEHEKANN